MKLQKAKAEKSEWREGTVQDFLDLSDADMELIETRLALAQLLKKTRTQKNTIGQLDQIKPTPFMPSRSRNLEQVSNIILATKLLLAGLNISGLSQLRTFLISWPKLVPQSTPI